MNNVKKTIVNILASTCLVLLLLVFIAAVIDGTSIHEIREATIQVNFFLQILGVNVFIFVGFVLIRKFESKYAILEFLLDISYIIIVLLISGKIFGWFSGRSWILVIMAVVVYLFGLFTSILRTRKDASEINELIKKRKEKNINSTEINFASRQGESRSPPAKS
ncbi:MAG: hypothetical protein FWE09_02120 [Treponema sp.]|nr:hypothetical protein [Treponema sp.]